MPGDLPTLRAGYLDVLVRCKACRHRAEADLRKLVDTGRGDTPLIHLPVQQVPQPTDRLGGYIALWRPAGVEPRGHDVSEEITARPPITTALGMYLQAIEAVHRERTIAFCYCAVGSSLRIVEATDEYHFPGLVMATPTDAGTLADQLNHERLGLSRQQAAAIIGQSSARFPRISEPSLVIIDCLRNSEGTHLARPALGQLVTAALLK